MQRNLVDLATITLCAVIVVACLWLAYDTPPVGACGAAEDTIEALLLRH